MTEIVAPPNSAPAPRVLEIITRLMLGIATALMLLIVLLLVAQVFARNVWNIGLPRAEEITRLAGVLTVYLVAPVLALKGQHVAVDVFVNLMPRVPQRICLALAELSIVAFSAVSIWGGWLYLQRAWKFTTPALGLPNLYLFAPIMACFTMLIIISLWRVATILKAERIAP